MTSHSFSGILTRKTICLWLHKLSSARRFTRPLNDNNGPTLIATSCWTSRPWGNYPGLVLRSNRERAEVMQITSGMLRKAAKAPRPVRVRPELLPSEHVALKSRRRTIWRSYFSFGAAWPEGSAVPLPSTKDTNRSPGPPGNCSSKPLGQRTSMRSKEVAEPSPKWRRGSLVER